MSLVDNADAAPAPSFIPQTFNPLIFRDTMQASRWPMMANTTEGNFPSMIPRGSMGVSHTDMSDEGGAQASGQFTVVNQPGGKYSGALLAANDFLFRSTFPRGPQTTFFGSGAATAVYAFSLAMINQFVREQYAVALTRLQDRAGAATVAAVQLIINPAGGPDSLPTEYDVIEHYLRLSSDRYPAPYEDLAKTPALLGLDDNTRLDLHYLFPRGVLRRLKPLGISMAQSNTLYTPGPPQVTSMTADGGQTLLTVMFRGPAIVRNFWGPAATLGKHLWLMCRPYVRPTNAAQIIPYANPESAILSGAPQIIPYVSADYDNGVSHSARTYENAYGRLELAPVIYVGQVLIISGNKPLDKDVFASAAGLGMGNSNESLAMSFTNAEMLPLLTVMVHPCRWGTYDIKLN